MSRYAREDIFPGATIELDCGEPAHIRSTPIRKSTTPPPRAPRYGDPLDTDFQSITKRLDETRKRLDEIAKVYRNARRA